MLHNFTGGNDGEAPAAGLTMDGAGNLYGTAYGGARGYGVVFRLSRAGSGWILTPLYTFDDSGPFPASGVVFGPDGDLYGTTFGGGQYGSGTVYRLRPSPAACHSVICPWEKTVLHTFSGGDDGAYPGPGNLVFDRAGNIFGTTTLGGFSQQGTVFELTLSNGGWTESILWDFVIQNGFQPDSGLIFDNSGNLYGTTSSGGTLGNDAGVVYQLSQSGSGWTENVLSYIQFRQDATRGGVVMDGQGNLFGTSGCSEFTMPPGGVFELTPSNGSWTFNVLHAFSNGSGPCDTPTMDVAGNVYGTSKGTGFYNDGEVFKLTPSNASWIYTTLVDLNSSTGGQPFGGVILDAAGNIYGTASDGGANGRGTIWMITP